MPESPPPGPETRARTWVLLVLLLGLQLSLHGYASRDGDQAYRLPLLLHRQSPALYAGDPFVRSFDAFNPHRGYLALLDVTSRLLGLSVALFLIHAATFLLTSWSLLRLARAAWPASPRLAGAFAAGSLLLARAGNIGTNHLFEPILLDRLITFSLGWAALAVMLERTPRSMPLAAAMLALGAWVHPSLGLQLTLWIAACWVAWACLPGLTGVRIREALPALGVLAIAMMPGLGFAFRQGGTLLQGLPPEEYRILAAYIQSPQHMIPHLWRGSQWLSWLGYPALALGAWLGSGDGSRQASARNRDGIALAVCMTGLLLGAIAIEGLADLRVTLFQPFRMATVARGCSLVLLSGHLARLWGPGRPFDRARVVMILAGLTSDRTMIAATAIELTAMTLSRLRVRGAAFITTLVWAMSVLYLAAHDTASGHVRLIAAAALSLGLALAQRLGRWEWSPGRLARVTVAAWAAPALALLAPGLARSPHSAIHRIGQAVAERWRYGEVPGDDEERLALWCRAHTPESSRFIGPPGHKSFRLWSRRSVAFNRAGSPYHAAGLADWAARYRDHVGFRGSNAAFAQAYLADRYALENRYDRLSATALAELARRQGAEFVVAPSRGPDSGGPRPEGPLILLHAEGRYAVYRVREPALASAGTG